MEGKEIILTKALIDEGISYNGGFNYEQIHLLGANQKQKGWKRKLVGRSVSVEIYEKFLSLKNSHLKKSKTEIQERKNSRQEKRKETVDIIRRKLSWDCPNEYFVFLQKKVEVNKPLSWSEQYNHPNWQHLRAIFLKRDKYTCRECYSQHEQLHVHHLAYMKEGFIWDIHPMHLTTLCKVCHEKKHGRTF